MLLRALLLPVAACLAGHPRPPPGGGDTGVALTATLEAAYLVGAQRVGVSADGATVVALTQSATRNDPGYLTVFARNSSDPSALALAVAAPEGSLDIVEATDLAISPDGLNVVGLSFRLDQFVNYRLVDGVLGSPAIFGKVDVTGPVAALSRPTALAFSPDGDNMYVSSRGSAQDRVSVFSRDRSTGALAFEAAYEPPSTDPHAISNPVNVAVRPDGRHVFLVCRGYRADEVSRVTVYERSASALTLLGAVDESEYAGTRFAGALKLLEAVAISPEGDTMYAASPENDNVAVLSLAPLDDQVLPGLPRIVQLVASSSDASLSGANAVAVSPDSRNVYVGSVGELAVFSRNGTGFLVHRRTIPDMGTVTHIALSLDWRSMYVTAAPSATGDGALMVFTRNATTPGPTASPTAVPTPGPSPLPSPRPSPVPTPVPSPLPTSVPTVAPCSPGFYFFVPEQVCRPCRPGFASPGGKPESCDWCDLSSYAPAAASPACTPCAKRSTRDPISRADVIGTSPTQCGCADSTTYRRGTSVTFQCPKCPRNGVCGSNGTTPYPLAGCMGARSAPPGRRLDFYECSPLSNCLGGPAFKCQHGRTGHLCSAPDTDHYAVGLLLFTCPRGSSLLARRLVAVAVAALIVLAWWCIAAVTASERDAGVVDVGVRFLQALGIVLGHHASPFGSTPARALLAACQFCLMDPRVFVPACARFALGETGLWRFAAVLAVPMALSVVEVAVAAARLRRANLGREMQAAFGHGCHAVFRSCNPYVEKKKGVESGSADPDAAWVRAATAAGAPAATSRVVSLWRLVFPALVQAALEGFHCSANDGWVAARPEVVCHGIPFKAWRMSSLLAGVGVALSVAAAGLKARRAIARARDVAAPAPPRWVTYMASIAARHRRGAEMWETVVLARFALLALAAAALRDHDPGVQCVVFVTTVTASSLTESAIRPYRQLRVSHLSWAHHTILIAAATAASAMSGDRSTGALTDTLAVVLCGLSILAAVAVPAWMLLSDARAARASRAAVRRTERAMGKAASAGSAVLRVTVLEASSLAFLQSSNGSAVLTIKCGESTRAVALDKVIDRATLAPSSPRNRAVFALPTLDTTFLSMSLAYPTASGRIVGAWHGESRPPCAQAALVAFYTGQTEIGRIKLRLDHGPMAATDGTATTRAADIVSSHYSGGKKAAEWGRSARELESLLAGLGAEPSDLVNGTSVTGQRLQRCRDLVEAVPEIVDVAMRGGAAARAVSTLFERTAPTRTGAATATTTGDLIEAGLRPRLVDYLVSCHPAEFAAASRTVRRLLDPGGGL